MVFITSSQDKQDQRGAEHSSHLAMTRPLPIGVILDKKVVGEDLVDALHAFADYEGTGRRQFHSKISTIVTDPPPAQGQDRSSRALASARESPLTGSGSRRCCLQVKGRTRVDLRYHRQCRLRDRAAGACEVATCSTTSDRL